MALEKIPAAGLEAGSVNATAIAVNSIPSSRLTTTGVVANSYGNSSQIPVVTIDSAGRITNASTTAVAGVTGFSYEGANNTFSITTGDGSTFKANISANSIAALALGSSGVVANVYGNATAIPVITIDEDGRISNATTTSVSGVTGVSYTAANSTLNVSTSISNYTAPLTAGNSSVQGLLKVVDSVANGSTDAAASANSVKTAYELASNAVSNATSYAATAYSNAVSQATTLAGTAYSNAVATAASDATSKSDTAYSNAVSQATTLAGTAYSNAVSVAASDATTKANTAYSNAVSVAASDATTKANSAYSNAVSQATTLAGNAYTNAVSQATTLAGNAYTNAVSQATTLAGTAYSNATSYADTKAGTAYSNATTFASNADNISSGTLSGARIQANNGIIGNTSGVFVRAGTGVTVNATGVHTNQDISNTANVTFGYMTITGNLVVQGTTTTVNTVNLSVQDNMIYLNSNNTVANPDLGFAGNYNDGTYHHAGFFRDATDARWKVFDNYLPEPDATAYIDTSNTSFQLANFQANVVYANLTGNVTGNVSGSANSSTYVGGNTAGDLRSYSDTVAGTAYSNAVSTAASDATTKAGTAYSNAVSYADTKAGTAYSNAVSTAASDATSKAATAYSNAVSTAASDATSKAATAYSNATSYAATIAGTAYSNAVAYAASNSYVNSTFLKLTGGSLTGNVATSAYIHANGTGGTTGGYFGMVKIGYGASYGTVERTDSDLYLQYNNAYNVVVGYGGGYLTATNSSRAPIFYDSDNTAYYVNPNGASNIGSLTSNSVTNVQTGTGSFVYQQITNTDAAGVYAYLRLSASGAGDGYLIKNRTTGNSMTNQSLYLWNDPGPIEFVPMGNTAIRTTISTGGSMTVATDVRAPIFYDSDDTTYYTNPAGSSYIKALSVGGDSGQSTYPLYAQSGQRYLVGLRNTAAANSGYYWWLAHDDDLIFHRNGSGDRFNFTGAGVGTATASWRAPIFYDSDNTSYYTDPASTSSLVGLTVSNTISGNISGYSKWIDKVPAYQWSSSTLPSGYNSGVETSFVSAAQGWPQYGVVLSVMGRDSSDPGGNFQLYMGHGASYGGLGLRVRSIDQAVNTWTSWKILLDASNYTSYAMPAGSSATNSVDVRAPLFYDSDNTGYYVNPASSTSGSFAGFVGIGSSYGSDDGSWGSRLNVGGTSYARIDARNNDGLVTTMYAHLGHTTGKVGMMSNHPLMLIAESGNAGGYVYNGSIRAPIFYDSDNTTYYLDAANSASAGALSLNGGITFGIASPYLTASSYIIVPGGAYFNSGTVYITSNLQARGGVGNDAAAALVLTGGTSGYTEINGSTRSPIYYDLSDTTFHTDPAGTSSQKTILIGYSTSSTYVYNVASTGYITFGTTSDPTNYSILTELENYNGNYSKLRLKWYTGIQHYASQYYGGHRFYDIDGTAYFGIGVGGNWSYSIYSHRAPIFYDLDNTGYYLDPNSTSNLYGLTVNQTITGSVSGNAATATTANALATGNNYQVNSLGIGTAASGTAGEIRATNNITAYYSDDRLKTKLGAIENAIDKVKSLNGFYYEANEVAQKLGYKVKREVGLSAQEIQAVLPEIVAPAPIDNRYLTIHYERVVPLLVEAIKEQQGTIDRLEALVNSLINKTGE